MKFSDYFAKSKELEIKDKKKKETNQLYYDMYYDYIFNHMDDYSKDANITVFIHGFNFQTHNYYDYGSVDLYGPYCFNYKQVLLFYDSDIDKMIEVWGDHVFVDDTEICKYPDYLGIYGDTAILLMLDRVEHYFQKSEAKT